MEKKMEFLLVDNLVDLTAQFSVVQMVLNLVEMLDNLMEDKMVG